MKVKQYGKTSKDQIASESIKCRKIVKEIINFGVNEQQMLKICYLLSLELENTVILKEVSNCIKKHLNQLSEESDSGLITDI